MSFYFKKIFKARSIRIKLCITVFLTVIFVNVVVGVVSFNTSKTNLQTEIINNLTLLADAKEGQIYAYLDFLKSRTLDFSSDGLIKDSLVKIEKNNSAEIVKSLNLHLQTKKSLDSSIIGIMIVDSQGKVIASTDEKEIGKSEAEDEYFIKGKTSVSFFEERDGSIHFGATDPFIVSAPLKDKDSGRFLGLLINVFVTNKLSDILSGKYQIDAGAATSEFTRSKTEEVYLVNKDKKMFVYSHLARGENLNSDIKMEVNTLPVEKCLENNTEISEVYQNYAKKEVIGASMCFPQRGWTLITEISTAEAFAPIGALLLQILLLTILAMAAVIVVIVLLANNIIKPIKTLSQGAKIISGGNLDYRVKITSGDEIEQLGNAFNDMVSKLKESYSGLSEKVKDQTSQLSKQIAETEEKNAFLEDTKRAVLNILEDGRELENNLQKFQLAAENAYEHIIITDESGKIIYANSAVVKTTGYSKEEVLGKTPSLWSGNMPKAYYDKMWNTIKTKKITFEGEIKNKRKSGEEYTAEISISPILDEKKEIKFYVGLERDVTRERNLMDELRKEKEGVEIKVEERTKELKDRQVKLNAALDSLVRGFLMFDKNENLLQSNKKVAEMLGKNENIWTLEEIDKRLSLKGEVNKKFRECLQSQKVIAIKNVNFTGKIFDVIFSPFYSEVKDKPEGALMLISDETEEKILDRSKDEFLSIASHELRTPLTSIRGNSALIKEHYMDKITDKDFREMIDDIHESSERLIQIVNDFLNVSRLEQGRMEFTKSNFSISEAISKTIEEVKSLADEKGLYIKFNTPDKELKQVYADPSRTKEVLINLIGNAVKYTQKGGITININQDKNTKVLIEDTGIGIDENGKNLLFRKFQQAGENILTRDTTKSTGLGLYISKLMTSAMNGAISLEKSEPNKGSVFVFSLPNAA